MKNLKVNISNLIFEIGHLNKIKRSQRKNNPNSVAEHSFRTAIIGYLISKIHGEANVDTVVKMCLFHDIPETRINDLDYINQKYCQGNEMLSLHEMFGKNPLYSEITKLYQEFNKGKTIEAKISRDADILEEIATEKQQADEGHPQATNWIDYNMRNLITPEAKQVASTLINNNSHNWWYEIIKKYDSQ